MYLECKRKIKCMGISKRKQKIAGRKALWSTGLEHRRLHHPAGSGCETTLHDNGSIRVRKSKKEYGMSLIGISER